MAKASEKTTEEMPAAAGPKPTIGRVVHYTDPGGNTLPAIVTRVHNATCIDAFVMDPDGHPYNVHSITSSCWAWPPRDEG